MNDFLKKLMTLATELNEAKGFNATVVINDIELLYDNHMTDLKKELTVTEQLLEERQRVLDAIPECKTHGACVPHAIEWIEEMKGLNV